MGKLGGGIFEISREASGSDAQTQAEFSNRLKALTKEASVVTTFGVFTLASEPGGWRKYMELIDEVATEGAQMFAQVHSNTMYNYYSFETRLPVDDLPQWKAVRRRPLDQQMRAFLDPSLRAALRTATDNASGTAATLEVEKLKVVYTMEEPNPTVGELARANSVHPVDALLDAALAADFALFFREPFANADQDDALELMRHPRSVVTFSDSGAHVTEIADSCLQTVLLSQWCRDRHAFTLEESVRKISFDVASHFSLRNRGLLREGYAGAIVVMDYDKLQPQMPSVVADLPTGAKRVFQG